MEIKILPISQLKSNTGQTEGVPKNPRLIKDDKFNKLVKSIQEDPEMLELREVIAYDTGEGLVVIAGNMRLKACKEAGIKEIPCKILPKDTPISKLKAYIIKDNVSFGEHNWDDLNADWEVEQLEDWGVDMPKFESDEDYSGKNKELGLKDFEDKKYTIKLDFTEEDYNFVKDKLQLIGQTPEKILYDALISL
jgi:ParB-like chromosome segregation protein Spo0J